MRVLRVAQKCYPDVVGGGPYHVHAMSRDQAAMGHDVTVLTVRHDPDAPRRERRDGYTVRRHGPTASPLGNDVSIGLARDLWNAEGFDVVHAHSHLYVSTNVAALRRRFDDVPLAITNHGLYSQSAPRWLFDWYLKTVGRWTLDRADVVFCYTDAERDALRERRIGSAVEVVRNGVDVSRFTPDGPVCEGLRGEGPTLLFVGRLVQGKRPGDAIGAVERLVESRPGLTLAVAGDGPLRADLEAQARERGLGGAVRFLGHVDYDAMPAVYRAADLLVLPSASEGFPRTVVEALATGTPVVTSELPQLRDVTGVGGASVPVGDVDGLADAVDGLLDDEDRRERCAREGRSLVSERYTWDETVRRTSERLEALASGRSL